MEPYTLWLKLYYIMSGRGTPIFVGAPLTNNRPELHKPLIDTETADVRQINTDRHR